MGCCPAASALDHPQGPAKTCRKTPRCMSLDSHSPEWPLQNLLSYLWVRRETVGHSQGQQAHMWLNTAVLRRGQDVRLFLQKPILDFGISSGWPRGIQGGKLNVWISSAILPALGCALRHLHNPVPKSSIAKEPHWIIQKPRFGSTCVSSLSGKRWYFIPPPWGSWCASEHVQMPLILQ